jgi:heme-degrading monooxygenase HmoA
MNIVKTPEPPYYAVIFTTNRTGAEEDEYQSLNDELMKLADDLQGYMGMESAPGLSVSYWKDEESIREWRNNSRHLFAQGKGISTFYQSYMSRICKVERDNGFNREEK